MVRFDKKWFNPLYFILNDLVKNESIRTILIYGGKGSTKTVSVAQILSKEAYVNCANSIAFRKEGSTIKTTLKESFNLAIKTTRLYPAFTKLEFMYRTTKDSQIVLKGLDDEEKAKGIESFKYLYIDELNHFEKDEYTQFNLSLRGMPGQKILASWNPVSENSWVKKELIDTYEFIETAYRLPCSTSFVKISTCGKVILIKTTYQDNFWIAGSPCGTYGYRDENLIAEYMKLATTDNNAYRVNVLGEWGIRRTGGEFWKRYLPEKHLKPVQLSKSTIHVSVDENVNPYVTQTIWQIDSDKKEFKQVHEILSKSPANNAPKAARQFIDWLNKIEYKDVVFVYGDPSAGKRSTIDENNASFFDKYISEIRKAGFTVVSRVERSAPEVALSGAFINAIYEENYGGWSIIISTECLVSSEDYLVVKEDEEGRMFKAKVKNKETGVTYEPHGHCSDTKRYIITTVLKELFFAFKSRRKRSGSISV